MKPKIFIFKQTQARDWVEGCAIAEDGHCLAGHISSNESWYKIDMANKPGYLEHYPGGFELVWVDDPLTHAGLQAAYRKNQQL